MSFLKPGGIAFVLAAFSIASFAADLEDDSKVSPLVRCFVKPEKVSAPFADGKFAPQKGETISFIGGTNTFEQQKYPDLEVLLQLAYPELELKIRNLAWQGDTVFEQVRPKFYFTNIGDTQPGSVPDQRDRIEPGIVFVDFGKMESLDTAPDSLKKFITAYKGFLDQLQTRTNRIVLVSPIPFFPLGHAKELAQARNETLVKVESAVRALAGERNFLYVDQFTPFHKSLVPEMSNDGIHLSQAGQRQSAIVVAKALAFPLNAPVVLNSEKLAFLKITLNRKDYLFQQYYHPTNWAFLYGDRQHVPASRDHLDNDKRWFIKEVKKLPGLIRESETDIHRYAKEMFVETGK